MNCRRSRVLLAGCLFLGPVVLGVGGCQWFGQRERPALSVPTSGWTVSHFAGNALSGPRAGTSVGDTAWPVTLQAVALTRLPTDGFEPVGPMARLVVGSDSTSVVTPSSRIVYSARLKTMRPDQDVESLPSDPAQAVSFAPVRGAVAVGSTVRFELASADSKAGSTRALDLMLSRRTDSGTIELAIQTEDQLRGVEGGKPVRELVVIDRQLESGVPTRLAVLVPFVFAESAARGVVAIIDIDPTATADPETQHLMTSQLYQSAADLKARAGPVVIDERNLLLSRAVESVTGEGGAKRGSLELLAGLTNAELTRTVLTVADEKIVDLIGAQVHSRLANLAQRDVASIAWLLDRSTVAALASVKQDEAAELLTPIQGALSIYAGEAGRQLDVLQSLAGEAASSADLFNRIVAEHFILLEESSPALRVRAYDWLAARGKAPAGYDPLDTAKARRAALERARTEPTTAPTAQTPITTG